jgi:hypothetical protein
MMAGQTGSDRTHVDEAPQEATAGDTSVILAAASQKEGMHKSKLISTVLKLPEGKYNDAVEAVVESNLRKNPNSLQVQNADGRSYGSETKLMIEERDPKTGAVVIDSKTGQPRLVEASTLTNGQLAGAMQGVLKDYKAKFEEFNRREKSEGIYDTEQALLKEKPALEARVAQVLPTILSPKAIADPATHDLIGKLILSSDPPPAGLFKSKDAEQQFLALRSDVQSFTARSTDLETKQTGIQADMATQGKFFPGKMNLCCCTNARNKSLGMMNWALTGKVLDGAACHMLSLPNLANWSVLKSDGEIV